MSLFKAFELTSEYSRRESFDLFQRNIPDEWVEEALSSKGVATIRKRRLPAEQVIWLVLGMALLRNRSIEEVADKLEIALPSPRGAVAKSAIPPARRRLGEEPMERLFKRCGSTWGHESARANEWRDLAVYGIDGTSLRLADTKENRETFEGWDNDKGPSSNPMMRLVVLMSLRSHLIVDAGFGSYKHSSEWHFAKELEKSIPSHSLTILDKLFLGVPLLLAIENQQENRHWMLPAKTSTKKRIITNHSPHDKLVEMEVSSEARSKDPSLPKVWNARAIEYQKPGFKPRMLLTSLLDPVAYPAKELIEMYHERWELELAYDELKTELLDSLPTIRSLTPSAVQQEMWGILTAFNLVRLEMTRIAKLAKLDPSRISFVVSLRFIQDEFDWSFITRSPGAIPRHLLELEDKIKRFILPPRRKARRYPREIKNDYRRYPRKTTPSPK